MATVLVNLTWIAMSLVTIGTGQLAFIWMGCQRRSWGLRLVFDRFWLGLAVTIALLQAWHLVMPIRPFGSVLIVAAGLLGLLSVQLNARRWLSCLLKRRRWELAICVVLGAWAANRATGPIVLFDTGLYHFTAVRWATEYPVVVGLANLHGRLGFNSAGLLYAAQFETWWPGRSNHFALGMLSVMVLFHAILELGAMTRRRRLDPVAVFHGVIGMTAAFNLFGQRFVGVTDFSTDVPVTLVLLYATGVLLRCLVSERRPAQRATGRVIVGTTLFSLAVCLKLSAVVMAGIGGLCIVVVVGRTIERRWRIILKPVILLLPLWLVSNVMMTGYVLYPVAATGVDVPWRVPVDLVNREAQSIAQWARWEAVQPEHAGGWDWFPGWLSRLPRHHPHEWIGPLAVVVMAMCLLRLRTRLWSSNKSWGLLLAPSLGGLVAWALSAPDPRFVLGPAWALAGSLCAIATWRWTASVTSRGVVTVLVLHVVYFGALLVPPVVRGYLFAPSGADHMGFHPAPKAQVHPAVSHWGLAVFVPTGSGGRLWDAPLPATPELNSWLRSRHPGDLGGGFVIEQPSR